MTELIGRALEIEEMERRYSNPGIKTLALWGRRRVGKTFLVQEFCKDKPHIILTAIEHSLNDSIRSFDEAIDRFTGTARSEDSRSFRDIVNRLESLDSEGGRLVIAIDEYTYLSEEDSSVDSYLQIFIDRGLQTMNAFLIICGSAIKMMEHIFTDGRGALYRRFIGPMKILPLTYAECRVFHPGMPESDIMRIYSIVGGIPLYHLMMNGDTVEDCVKECFLGPYAPLREESAFIVAREMEPVSTNLKILDAIADGRSSGKEIADYAGLEKETCYSNLRNLRTIGIVRHLDPMCGANTKEKIYRISDNLIRFNYEVLVPNMAAVSGRDKDLAYDIILPHMQTFFGPGFEDICKQYVSERHRCKEVGVWWGKTGDGTADVDIVALCEDRSGEYHLVCECKFRGKETGMREMKKLEETSRFLRNCYNMRYCLFSRDGFTDELEEYAESRGIELLAPEDMYDGIGR